MEANLGETIEKQNQIQLVNDQIHFHYHVVQKEKNNPYSPFKYKILNDHMKNSRVINAKKMDLKVMTNLLKRTRKNNQKKSK